MFSGPGTRGRLEGCELWGNADGGVVVQEEAHPTLASCIFRDHADGLWRNSGSGVYVFHGSNATVGADCVFERNAGGDVVRE